MKPDIVSGWLIIVEYVVVVCGVFRVVVEGLFVCWQNKISRAVSFEGNDSFISEKLFLFHVKEGQIPFQSKFYLYF